MRTQLEVNHYLQDTTIKNAQNLLDIEKCLENDGLCLPNNVIIHKNGIGSIDFIKWFENRKFPTTYKECCDVLLIPPYYNLRYHTYENGYNEYTTSNSLLSLQDKLNTLGKLIICRNAYWKICVKQMGLDKPWGPDWTSGKPFYCISTNGSIICKGRWYTDNKILAFPTEEMRDVFYENFKDLIEQCKELL